mmetsp:Transcript_27151/g.51128  ORF Transcript_27151/g.51128 Transcript_27151/m.51128 type:complete len:294 (-) Transcript_27151:291-1172(-)
MSFIFFLPITMRQVALVLVCLAQAGHGRRVQSSSEKLQSMPSSGLQKRSHHGSAGSTGSKLNMLAPLLLALNPRAAFELAGPVTPRLLRAAAPKMVLGYPKVAFKPVGDSTGDWINVFDWLLQERTIFLGQQLNDENVNNAIASLLYLDNENSAENINFYINCPGGSVISCLALYDTMGSISSPVSTCNMGQAAAMGSLLLSAGTRGKRVALPNSRVLLKSPGGQTQGQAADIKTDSEMILKVTDMLVTAYVQTTGQPREKIIADMDRDNWMNAQQALEYGIVDQILKSKPPA